MNAPVRRLAVVVIVLFFALLRRSTYIQFVQASLAAATSRATRAPCSRTTAASAGRSWSPARRSPVGADRRRADSTGGSTPRAELYAHLTGYYSSCTARAPGSSAAENDLLAGTADQLFYRRIVDAAHRHASRRAPRSS